MKTIGIYNYVMHPSYKWDETNYEIGNIGGSEIWAIEVANEFRSRGYEVYMFGNPNEEHDSKNGVHYLKCNELNKTCLKVKFDVIFLSRTVECINDIVGCDNIFLMLHDVVIIGSNGPSDFPINKIRKVFYQSDFQKEAIQKKYLIPDEKFYRTFEAINQSKYDDLSDTVKENKMLYSSGFGRGLRWLIENVFERVKEEIPDFKIDVCGHFDGGIFKEFLDKDGITVLGNISREELVKKQCESKVWIYPNHGYDSEYNRNNETFCITAIENAYAKNACILGKWGCFASTLEGYNGFVGDGLYENIFEPMDYDNLDLFADALVSETVKCLKDEEYRKSKVESSYEIVKKYTWKNVVDGFETLIESECKSVMVYVITHKNFPYLIQDEIHRVLQVGAAINGNLGIGLCDNVGDNISEKNKFFLDTTGVYWIWKNAPHYDFIGNQAYRRDFRLSKDEIIDILNKYDVIASPVNLGTSIYDHYKGCHIIKDLDTCGDIIDELYPEYKGKFSEFMKTKEKLYIGCGYITSYEKYNDINEFVFSVLFELEKRYGFKTYEEWLDYAEKSGQKQVPDDHKYNGITAAEYQAHLFGQLYERIFTFYVSVKYGKIYEREYVRLDKEYEGRNLKTLLCCIGRLENQYIREYVEYNKALGFTNICLYDNNRDGEEDFHDVIGDYINNGFVILKDYRNITEPCQFMAYNECYAEYGDKYDWIAFLDIDEFIFLNNYRSINEFLLDDRFKFYDKIHLNWLVFGDGDEVYNSEAPVLQRIRKPLDVNLSTIYDFPDTFHVKPIIRGGLGKITYQTTPHTPIDNVKCCNSYGIECDPRSPFTPYDFRNGGILHFTTKTAEEYANKLNRGFCDGNPSSLKKMVELFFKRNAITEEKVEVIKRITGYDASYLLPYNGEKNKDVQIYSLCFTRKNFDFLDDSVVTPLQVGAANGTNVCALKDNVGDNISESNYFYIESTGTYWIWKNVNDAKYKGQMQYRRPLSGVCETMDFEKIFENYDVITCIPFNHPENNKPTKEQPMFIPANTVEEGYKFSNCLDDLLILEMAVKYYFPEYSEDYDKYIKKGEDLYYSNGFVMRAEDYDKYAEFLFGCLNGYLAFANIHSQEELFEHVRYNLETGKYIRYNDKSPINDAGFKWQTEIGGFLSERLWTLWVQHNFKQDRIYKLPYIKMEPDNMYT